MSKILHISASIRGEESVSRSLSTKLTADLAEQESAAIVTRDLSAIDLPYVSADSFAAGLVPADERTQQQTELAAIADQLIAELQGADTIVLGVPIYNFGVPASVKAWADLVARAGTTFRYTANGPEGLLKGKKAYIAVASGGTKVNSEIDFMTPWLTHFLGFLGITDVSVVAADAIMGEGGEETIRKAHEDAVALVA